MTTLGTDLFATFDYQNGSAGSGEPGTYSIKLGPASGTAGKGSDIRAIQDGYVSLTPLAADRDVEPSTMRWVRSIL